MDVADSQVRLTIGSYYEHIELVQIVVEESLSRLEVDPDTCHWIGIAVREAVANAIKHGNQQDPSKDVHISCGVEAGELIISVRDEGVGFDPTGVADPLAPENLLRASGRGIFFMKKFVDDIDFSFLAKGGTVVTLRKRLSPSTLSPSAGSVPQKEENDG